MIFAAPLELGENLLSFELPEAVIGGDSVSMTDPWWNFTMIDTKMTEIKLTMNSFLKQYSLDRRV